MATAPERNEEISNPHEEEVIFPNDERSSPPATTALNDPSLKYDQVHDYRLCFSNPMSQQQQYNIPHYQRSPVVSIPNFQGFPSTQVPYNAPTPMTMIETQILRELIHQNQQMLILLQQLIPNLNASTKENKYNYEASGSSSSSSKQFSQNPRKPRSKYTFAEVTKQKPVTPQHFRRRSRNGRNSINHKKTPNVPISNYRRGYSSSHSDLSELAVFPRPKFPSNVSCNYCKKLGHNVRVCRRRPYCRYCGKRGHIHSECYDHKNQCLHCKQYGHLIQKCPTRQERIQRTVDILQCPFCQKDHLGVDCQNRNNSIQQLPEEQELSLLALTPSKVSPKSINSEELLSQRSPKQGMTGETPSLLTSKDKPIESEKLLQISPNSSIPSQNCVNIPRIQSPLLTKPNKVEETFKTPPNLSTSSKNSIDSQKTLPLMTQTLLPDESLEMENLLSQKLLKQNKLIENEELQGTSSPSIPFKDYVRPQIVPWATRQIPPHDTLVKSTNSTDAPQATVVASILSLSPRSPERKMTKESSSLPNPQVKSAEVESSLPGSPKQFMPIQPEWNPKYPDPFHPNKPKKYVILEGRKYFTGWAMN